LGPQARDGQSTEQAATPTSAHRAKSARIAGSSWGLGGRPTLSARGAGKRRESPTQDACEPDIGEKM